MKYFVFYLCLLSPLFLQAQQDTLKAATVRAKQDQDMKMRSFAPGLQSVVLDSATLALQNVQSVATVLSQHLPTFVKQYSINGLATLNLRGASAAQSQVYWQGVPIQNPALGIADVAALPVLSLSKVNVVYGGAASLWGSGTVGGIVLLQQASPIFDTTTTLSADVLANYGSFSQISLGLKALAYGKRNYFSMSVLHQQAENDIAYKDDSNRSLRLPNAGSNQQVITALYSRKLNTWSKLTLSTWWQQYARAIPPAINEVWSTKEQNTQSVRIVADWDRVKSGRSQYIKSSLLYDNLMYNDPSVYIQSNSYSYQYYQEVGVKRSLGKGNEYLLFAPVTFSWMLQPLTQTIHNQTKLALALAMSQQLLGYKVQLSGTLRGEQVQDRLYALYGANAQYSPLYGFKFRANVQRTYRVPSLNELYYFPGGNTQLKPEIGWNIDAGYELLLHKSKWTLAHTASYFNRHINDWIIWLGGSIWTPRNIAQVYSRGVETSTRISYECNAKWVLWGTMNTAYTLATTEKSNIANDGSIGKQIPYTPRYTGGLTIGLQHQNWHLQYQHSYTGYRFIVADESAYLLPYNVGNIQLSYINKIKGHSITINALLQNVWNQPYTIMAYRPMPGMNAQVGVQWGLWPSKS